MYGTNFTVQVEVVGWITFREVALYLYFRGFNKSRLLQFCLRVGSPALVFPYGPFSGYRPLLHHRKPLTEKFIETPANQTSYNKNVTLSDFPFCLRLFSTLDNGRYPYWLLTCLSCGGCCYYWILCAEKKEL